MKSFLLSIFLFLSFEFAIGQDTLMTYTKILKIDSVGKNEIFDKALIWCSRTFTNSNFAIKVNERESGIIAGKASYYSKYKYNWNTDLLEGTLYNNFYFDWLIEIKEGKLRFSTTNITIRSSLDNYFAVTNSNTAPYKSLFQSKKNAGIEYGIAKDSFFKNLDDLINSLNNDLQIKKVDW